ncbi:MAG: hypothetical protein ABW158_15835 [Candidatus Thiodiazotropha sp. 6PDIVS]
MMALTNAEKQQAYRERIKVKKIADELFDGRIEMTIEDFLEVMSFDEIVFHDELDGLGEETEEYRESKNKIYQEAYDEAYQEVYELAYQQAYDKAYKEAIEAGEITEDDDELDLIEQDADEYATDQADEPADEAATEAVNQWETEVKDYGLTCVEYSLVDLLAAYRAALSI